MKKQGREYLPEAVYKAQELYCVLRLTYAQVSEETGIAQSTLKRWAQRYEWSTKREKLAKAQFDLVGDTILARSAMLKKLITSKDAQTGFAVASLETLAMRQEEAARKGRVLDQANEMPMREIRTQADALTALKEAVEMRLNQLLINPEDVDFKEVSQFVKAIALIGDMQPADNADTEKAQANKGISAKMANEIRDQILGRK